MLLLYNKWSYNLQIIYTKIIVINYGMVKFMNENNDKKNASYYFPTFTILGAGAGILLNKIAIGLCFGATIGFALDYKKKK